MTSIADSDAFFDDGRMLAQHQAALTLLQGMLADPKLPTIHWLDLASGRGQIIAHLEQNLTEKFRKKLHFVGYDIDNLHTRHAQKIASSMELGGCRFGIGELARFSQHSVTTGPWNFITITNTIHEISPSSLADIIANALVRLHDSGCLFIYDMDNLPAPELGAVMWTAQEITEIV